MHKYLAKRNTTGVVLSWYMMGVLTKISKDSDPGTDVFCRLFFVCFHLKKKNNKPGARASVCKSPINKYKL